VPVFQTPGVYRVPQAPPRALMPIRTDIAAFIGYAERGPLPPAAPALDFRPESVALKIAGWKAFESTFGSFHSNGYLPYAVRAFFENGGRECYVVRVAAIRAPNIDDRPANARAAIPGLRLPATLNAAAARGARTLAIDTTTIAPDDVLELSSAASRELVLVRGVGSGTVDLVDPLRAGYDPADVTLIVRRVQPAATVLAKSAGRWGNRLSIELRPFTDPTGDTLFSLRVVCAGDDVSPREEEFYRRLSIHAQHRDNDALYAPTVLQRSRLVDLVAEDDALDIVAPLDTAFERPIPLTGGQDGLTAVTAQDFLGGEDDLRGLRLLQDVDDAAIVCVPDAVFATPTVAPDPPPLPADPCAPVDQTPAPPMDATGRPPSFDEDTIALIQQTVLAHCDRNRYRVAVLDVPADYLPRDAAEWGVTHNLRNRAGKFGALYYPWVEVPNPYRFDAVGIAVPPCGHVAGIYARTDLRDGVQKPPANETLEFAANLLYDVDDDLQGPLNEARVNCLRPFPGRGLRVWGARSLSADGDDDWMFIHVRRLMSMIEQTVDKGTRWAVFESHDDTLRRTIAHSLTVLLERIWRAGGFKGERAAESFYVKCDETNNPPASVDRGLLVCEVGVAIAAAMEFIVFEIRRDVASLEVVEEAAS
jgi:hypothetical protein